MPSELEDDVLMAYLEQHRELEKLQERAVLVEKVWKSLDLLVRQMLRNPILVKEMEPQLKALRRAVEVVLTFDEQQLKEKK